jgi:CRISPR-associated protein Cmr2
MSDINKQKNISAGLENFTTGVQKIVEDQSGFLIYAGGDDVMALLPLEFALNCAKDLRQLYLDCFAAYPDINTTLSGAIEYAHIKMPLGKVLGDAHHLLDEIAKDKTGRDAIAIRVWKPGGQHLEWAMPWQKALDAQGAVIIDLLAKDFQKDQQETPFSNSFFFHVEERFALLNDNADAHQGFPFDKAFMIDLIAADYLNSGLNKNVKITLEAARHRITPLLTQCFEVQRTLINDKEDFKETNKLNSKALQLIRFLAQKGVEHG